MYLPLELAWFRSNHRVRTCGIHPLRLARATTDADRGGWFMGVLLHDLLPGAVALLAGHLPAGRTPRADPAIALRAE
jgi:hypothetical protein